MGENVKNEAIIEAKIKLRQEIENEVNKQNFIYNSNVKVQLFNLKPSKSETTSWSDRIPWDRKIFLRASQSNLKKRRKSTKTLIPPPGPISNSTIRKRYG